jgi:phosphate transport system substrate-binding protein
VINLVLAFAGHLDLFPLIFAAITLISVLSIVITCKIAKKNIMFEKKIIIIYCSAAFFLSGIVAFQYYDKSTKVLFEDYQVERIADEVELYDYHPFYTDNRLKTFDEPATISFTEYYPVLDGATAAYPVYAAMAQELYQGLDGKTVDRYVSCSNTGKAYQRLIDGEIDIFFGAQPSQQQMDAAQEKGVEFTLTPIAKEAFVFFVHKDNPVNSLTLEQIQDIYQKKITNWNTVGGKAEKIIPFQRPENSGSQTIMLARVMDDKPLPSPLQEEYAAGMGGVINRVASYRNYSSSIGYSFRFFATGMKPNEDIKLLAINGIEPSVENIRNGAYPFTVDVYAVTAGSSNENTPKLIQWILSEQGQGFIETCGYVRRRSD